MIGVRRGRIGWGVVGLAVAGLGWVPEGIADSIHLKSGDVIEGEILDATRNTVTLRAGGTVLPTSFGAIKQIVLTLADGSELAGELLSWKDGVYEIRSANLLMQIKDGVIIEGDPETVSAELETEPAPAAAKEPSTETPAATVAMLGLPEFTMENGQVVYGQIIHATGSIVTIRLHGGGVVPTSRAQIDTVRFVDEDGAILVGSFESWSDNVYQLKNGDQQVVASLSDGAAEAGPPPALQSQPTALQSLDEPVVAAIESTDAAITPAAPEDLDKENDAARSDERPAPAVSSENDDLATDVDLDDEIGAGGPVSEAAVAALSEARTSLAPAAIEQEEQIAPEKARPHLVEPSVADVDEDGDEVVFEFRLSEPADRPLVILYAATDDTARAGQDFEAKSGVITFSAGSEYAEVRIPLIDDEQSENSEQFHLFLSGDPETVQFSKRQIPATISDND